jgi:hypothetical protein
VKRGHSESADENRQRVENERVLSERSSDPSEPRVMPRRTARAWGSVDRGKHRRAIELRKHQIPEAELVEWREGNTGHRDMRVVCCSGGVREPGMCGHSLHGNRETSGRSLHGS